MMQRLPFVVTSRVSDASGRRVSGDPTPLP